MAYYDADGFYFHEEQDIADPGAGFSELLNKPTEAMPDAVRRRVEIELTDNPEIVDALIDLILASEFGVSKCVHRESGVWVWDGPGNVAATHYLLPDDTGALVARPTLFPTPSAGAPELNW